MYDCLKFKPEELGSSLVVHFLYLFFDDKVSSPV